MKWILENQALVLAVATGGLAIFGVLFRGKLKSWGIALAQFLIRIIGKKNTQEVLKDIDEVVEAAEEEAAK